MRSLSLHRWFSFLAAAAVLATAPSVRAAETLGDLGPAPDFKFQTLDGDEISKASLKGKVVIVDFWATWCAPCLDEIPGYIALQKTHEKDGLVVIGISLDRRGPAHVKQFAEKNGINYVLVMGDDGVAEAFGGFDAIPTTFLIDRDGRIRHRKTGSMPHDEYERLVKALL